MTAAPDRQPGEGAPPRALAVSGDDPAHALLRDLLLALQIRRLRGENDGRTREQVRLLLDRLRDVAGRDGAVRLRCSGPHLYVNRQRISPRPEVRMAIQSFTRDWRRSDLGGFEFAADLTEGDLAAFLGLYGGLLREASSASSSPEAEPCPAAGAEAGIGREVVPGIRILPGTSEESGAPDAEDDLRADARRAFFLALAAARKVVRQLSARRIPELRISRAVVHQLIDNLVGEPSSLVGMSAIQDFDRYTFQHSVHVSILSLALGQSLGLARQDLADLGVAALFHDLGKVHVPKEVLQKPAPFDARDWALVRGHPLWGARDLVSGAPLSDLQLRIMLVCAEHHLRYDGSGYPRLDPTWRQGLFARIVSIADCFDAMTAARAYVRRPLTPEAVVRQMLERSGTSFDPRLLRLFVGRVGFYPVGTVLRLMSGELALVIEPPGTARELELPRVRMLHRTEEGWVPAEERRLAERSPFDPRRTIRATCHPLDLGLDVDQLLGRFFFPGAEAPARPATLPKAS